MRIDVVWDQFHCCGQRGESACSIIRKPPCRAQIIVCLAKIRSKFYSSFKFPDRIQKEALHAERIAKVGMCFGSSRVKLISFAKLFNRGVQISLLLIGPAK